MTKEEIYTYLKKNNGFEEELKGSSYGPNAAYDWELSIAEGKGLMYISDNLFYFFDNDSFIKINEREEVFGYKFEAATPENKQRVQIFFTTENGNQTYVYELSESEAIRFLSYVTANGKHKITYLRMNETKGYGTDKYVTRAGILNGSTVSIVEKLDVIDFISETMTLKNGQSRTLSCSTED